MPKTRTALVGLLMAAVLGACSGASYASHRPPDNNRPQGNQPGNNPPAATAPANHPPAGNPQPRQPQPGQGGNPQPGQGGTRFPWDEPYDGTVFENPGTNPFVETDEDEVSTFALDVDTASYAVTRRFLADGNLPDPDSVRVEEFVNAFPTGWEHPRDEPFAIGIDGARSPFTQTERYDVARIAILGRELEERRPDVALTFVIDVSGSMDMENRLGLVKASLEILVGELRPRDTIGIVVYGDHARLVLPPTPVAESAPILDAIHGLRPEGSTNAEAGLLLGYEVAIDAYRADAVNRVILASDGVANVGVTSPEGILARIHDAATNHINLVALGFGMGNFNDVLMERLADEGDGFYAYIDTLDEAERLFIDELASTLVPIARDAKVQVQWNRDAVVRYRLIGFENRAIADEDFRNDRVEAGSIGAGHAVTALYELKLRDGAFGAIGTVTLRWADPATGETSEISTTLDAFDIAASFRGADRHFRLATTAAAFAEVLRGSWWAQGIDLDVVRQEAFALFEDFPEDRDVRELIELIDRATELSFP